MSKEDSIMDFFENVKRAVSDTAQTVSKTSGKVADKVKTRYSIYDMNGEIKRILGEIGLEIYQSYKNDEAELSDSILEKCRELDAKNEMIEAAELSPVKIAGKRSARTPFSATSAEAGLTAERTAELRLPSPRNNFP